MYKAIEEITLNTWPAEQTLLLQGWVLRSASGYTKRANSVNPLYEGEGGESGTGALMEKIQLAEQFYQDAGQKPVFKITPFIKPGNLDTVLAERGYAAVEPSSVRVLELDRLKLPDSRCILDIQEEWSEYWLDRFAEMTELPPDKKDTLRRMLRASSLRMGYALLLKEGVPSACGLGVLQQGYIGLYDIVTTPANRRQGLAEHLLLGLLQWGKSQGAACSFLQVVQANYGASALYDKLGFQEIYQYWYRVKG